MTDFTCPQCGSDSIVEVTPGMTRKRLLNRVVVVDYKLVCSYDEEFTILEEGVNSAIRPYRCAACGRPITKEEMFRLAKVECADCGKDCDKKDIRPWKYEPDIKLCDDCHDTRMAEEDQ